MHLSQELVGSPWVEGHVWNWLEQVAREEALDFWGFCCLSQTLLLWGWLLGVRGQPCPTGTWRTENWLGVPLSPRPCYRLSHPGERGVPARTAFLPINPHGVSVRTQWPGLVHRWGNGL